MTSLKNDNWIRTRARALVMFGLPLVLFVSLSLDVRAAVNLIKFERRPADRRLDSGDLGDCHRA